jgi:hypothetical protein
MSSESDAGCAHQQRNAAGRHGLAGNPLRPGRLREHSRRLLDRRSRGGEASGKELLTFYADGGNQGKMILAAVLAGIAALVFIAFAAGVRALLVDSPWLERVAAASATLFTALWIAAVAVGTAVPATFAYSDRFNSLNGDLLLVVLGIARRGASGIRRDDSAAVRVDRGNQHRLADFGSRDASPSVAKSRRRLTGRASVRTTCLLVRARVSPSFAAPLWRFPSRAGMRALPRRAG